MTGSAGRNTTGSDYRAGGFAVVDGEMFTFSSIFVFNSFIGCSKQDIMI